MPWLPRTLEVWWRRRKLLVCKRDHSLLGRWFAFPFSHSRVSRSMPPVVGRRWREKLHLALKRLAHHFADAHFGSIAQRTARSAVMCEFPWRSRKAMKSDRRLPSRSSLKPSARRTSRYSSSAAASAIIGHLPATAGPAPAGRSDRPWRRWRSCHGSCLFRQPLVHDGSLFWNW